MRLGRIRTVKLLTPRMVAAYLTTLDYMRKQLLAAYDTAQDMYGSAAMSPEEAWHQPEE